MPKVVFGFAVVELITAKLTNCVPFKASLPIFLMKGRNFALSDFGVGLSHELLAASSSAFTFLSYLRSHSSR